MNTFIKNPFLVVTGLIVCMSSAFMLGIILAPNKTVSVPVNTYIKESRTPADRKESSGSSSIPENRSSDRITDSANKNISRNKTTVTTPPVSTSTASLQENAHEFSASSFRNILKNGDPIEAITSFSSMLKNMNSSEIEQALNILATSGGGRETYFQKQLLMYRWGQLDGQTAMNWLETAQNNRHWSRNRDSSNVMSGWASTEPDAAIAWAKSHFDGEENPYMPGIVKGIAVNDISRAMELTSSLPYGRTRGKAAHALVDEWMKDGIDAAIAWTDGIEDIRLKNGIVSIVADRYARIDRPAAANWELSMKEGDEIARAAANIAAAWTRRNPQEAADWAASLTDKNAQSAAIQVSLQHWTYKDPVASADWLEAQPQSTTKDTALIAFSSSLSSSNPGLALDWAGSISDPDKRNKTVGSIIKTWYKKDPKAATSFINNQ